VCIGYGYRLFYDPVFRSVANNLDSGDSTISSRKVSVAPLQKKHDQESPKYVGVPRPFQSTSNVEATNLKQCLRRNSKNMTMRSRSVSHVYLSRVRGRDAASGPPQRCLRPRLHPHARDTSSMQDDGCTRGCLSCVRGGSESMLLRCALVHARYLQQSLSA